MQLNAHYFRQHTYTIVPRHLREDLKWIADVGTEGITIGCLEQDLFAIQANLDIIFGEAERTGLKVSVIPSRWGGFIAGAPKVPSIFTSKRPDTWILDRNGRPIYTDYGPISSVHHPDTFELFTECLESLLARWPVDSIIWDEPKALLLEDHSEWARKSMPPGAGPDWHMCSFAAFFDRVGHYIHEQFPAVRIAMFLHGQHRERVVDCCARITNLDVFGLDARPWSLAKDTPKDSGAESGRSLIDDAPRFFKAARENGLKTMMLLENHNMPHKEDLDLMDTRMPEILALRPDFLHYYYYPRNVCDPERQMEIISLHFRGLTSGAKARSGTGRAR
jgi:hypothetical protein